MDDEMNNGELLLKVSEENTLRKVLLIIKESKDLEEVEAKIKALLEQ